MFDLRGMFAPDCVPLRICGKDATHYFSRRLRDWR